jgi:hypothetical protein
MNLFRSPLGLLVCGGILTFFGCAGVADSGHSSPAEQAPAAEAAPFDPTVNRAPPTSKSLTLAPDWQAPAPTRTEPARAKERVKPSLTYGVPTRAVGPSPSDGDLAAIAFFPEPLKALSVSVKGVVVEIV